MKKLFLSILLATATSVAFGQGQGELTTTTTTTTRPTTSGQLGTQLPNGRPGAVPYIPREGAVQVAIRTGRPLQLLNPLAPPRYGTAQEHTSHEPKDPGKPKGIVLFAWTF
jgi:hypothetical protein